ncbi:TetR family transcriptional regulator [Kineococcus sp. R8]|uniref:TetR family transcriptional regulator n=1 Tax=Kineococcus siccus TaxID=2696567 RepID=UPI0014120FFC|nr:TetR family transcriptional regulator [Kineococcus siccus]
MSVTREPSTRDDVRAAVVAAAARLLREAGAEAVTTRAVAQAAGVQAPTLYRLFGDKDGLVDAVAEHVMAAYVAGEAGAADGTGDPVADLRTAWDAHVDFGLANPELFALLSAPGRRDPSPAAVAGIEVLRGRVHRLAAAGLLRVDEERAVTMIHAAGTGTVLALLEVPVDRRDAGLSAAVLDALLGALLRAAPAVADAGPRALAIAFATAVPDLPGLSDAERALMAEWLDRAVRALREA